MTVFVPLENLQDRYHERDPAGCPRTARTAYQVDPLKFERAVAAALKRNHEADLSNVVTAFARRVDALARRELVARELARKGD